MTVMLELEPDVEARLQMRAAQFGQDVPTYLQEVAQREAFYPMNEPLTDEEFERISDELADMVGPDVPNWSNEDISREVIYGDRG